MLYAFLALSKLDTHAKLNKQKRVARDAMRFLHFFGAAGKNGWFFNKEAFEKSLLTGLPEPPLEHGQISKKAVQWLQVNSSRSYSDKISHLLKVADATGPLFVLLPRGVITEKEAQTEWSKAQDEMYFAQEASDNNAEACKASEKCQSKEYRDKKTKKAKEKMAAARLKLAEAEFYGPRFFHEVEKEDRGGKD